MEHAKLPWIVMFIHKHTDGYEYITITGMNVLFSLPIVVGVVGGIIGGLILRGM